MTSVIKVSQLMALNMFVDELIVMISDQKRILGKPSKKKSVDFFHPILGGWKVIFRGKLEKIFCPPKCVSTL